MVAHQHRRAVNTNWHAVVGPGLWLLPLALDVTKPQEIIDAFAVAKETFGRIDIVVNNAGRGALGEVEAAVDEDVRALFETNFWGVANVSREAVRFFREVNPAGVGGRLLQMGSGGGLQGTGAMPYYSASKFGMSRVMSIHRASS